MNNNLRQPESQIPLASPEITSEKPLASTPSESVIPTLSTLSLEQSELNAQAREKDLAATREEIEGIVSKATQVTTLSAPLKQDLIFMQEYLPKADTSWMKKFGRTTRNLAHQILDDKVEKQARQHKLTTTAHKPQLSEAGKILLFNNSAKEGDTNQKAA